MDSVEKFQKQLLEHAQHNYYETPISEATQKAFLETPRHKFIKRYRKGGSKEWVEVTEENLAEHLPWLYADRAVVLFGDDSDVSSTISQPSFVLRMLDMLQLEPGQNVFELGAGSGWNAALVGHLVGPEGKVYSLELIPEVARVAKENVESMGISNVHIIEGDAGEGYPDAAPYDRVIFTAGAYDLPRPFFEQVAEGGLMLAVIKNEGGGDTLFLLRKTKDHFESIDAMLCGFVPMKGSHQFLGAEPIEVESLPGWDELKDQPVARRPYWWGGKGTGDLAWRKMGIRSFLSISEPSFRAFKLKKDERHTEYFFGLWDPEDKSLVLAKEDALLSYGNSVAQACLLERVEQWTSLGMPSAASFHLKIYPIDFPLNVDKGDWHVKRKESQFVWSLP